MIVITGGAGFIGSNIVAELEKRGKSSLVVCDFLEKGDQWHNIAKRNLFDILHPEHLFSFLEAHKNHIEAVIHMGAMSSTDAIDGDLILKHNYRLSLDLFGWCGRHRARFIYASSAATYGNGEHGFMDQEDASYLSCLRPMNLYGWSKHTFDRTVLLHAKTKDIAMPPQWVGLKFFNVYGPNEYHKGGQSSVIPHFLKQIQESGKAHLFKSMKDGIKDGEQARDFVNVHDAVDVVLWLLENTHVNGFYNVGSGKAHTFLDMANALFKALQKEAIIDFIPLPERLVKHYQYFTKAPLEKLRAVGYNRPMTSLEDGVVDYVHHYLLKNDSYR